MKDWEFDEERNWELAQDRGDSDFQLWLSWMDVDGTPWFEGCECDEYRDTYAADDYEDDMIALSERVGKYSGENITRFQCPFCGRKYWVYTTGPCRGHEAHEAD